MIYVVVWTSLSAMRDAAEECKVNVTFRQMLGRSHVAAISIAMLLMFSGLCAIREPALCVGAFVGTAVAIGDISRIPHSLYPFTRLKLLMSALEFAQALLGFGVAWGLSQWVYGVGPLCCLRSYGNEIRRTAHVRSSKEGSC